MNAKKLVLKKYSLSLIFPKWGLAPLVQVITLFISLTTMLPSAALAASDANLAALSLSAGTLAPAFSSATVSYTSSVANTVSSITVTLTVSHNQATAKVNTVPVTLNNQGSGTSNSISLNVGSNTITTLVTAQDGTTKAYTINVTRLAELSATTVTTAAATGITAATATLNGTVSSNGANVSAVSFDYGLNTAYGNSIDATPSTLADPALSAPVSAELIGLNCNTVIHYRAIATNSQGTTYGADQTLTTTGCSTPFPATACAATRFNNDLSCGGSDVSVSSIAKATTSDSTRSCISGAPVVLDLDVTVNFGSASRWDVGIFIANDGKLPTKLPINGGASSCSVEVLPNSSPFMDLDGAQGTGDICGDGTAGLSGVKHMTAVSLPCKADPGSAGKIFVPYVVSWDNQRSPVGNLCTSNLYPVPNTSSKCNSPLSSVSVDVLVLPTITKTNGATTINPGANTAYTVEVFNNSGGTLLDSVFKDPAVAGLTVNSVTCSATTGATCPATTIAAMQGAGITIPSSSLPNDTKLTFIINASLSAAAEVGTNLVNTATVSIGGNSATATDTDLIQISPTAAMSFVSSSVTENATSVLTITFTNPTNADVTGVGFTDNYPPGLVNTSNANAANSCGGTVTTVNGGSSLQFSGGTIPASGSCTVTVNVTSATEGFYTNSTGTITSSSSISAVSATLTVTVPVYGGYNACDVAANPLADANNALCTYGTPTAYIKTKVAGTPFQLDIVALKSGTPPQRDTNYGKQATVELLDASDSSGALDAYNCRSSWTVIPGASLITGNFTSGRVTTGSFTVAEAYPNVRVHAKYYTGSAREGCSTDMFAIRPGNFTMIAQDANWEAAGTARTLNNTDIANPGSATGAPYSIHKAGKPFTFIATANNAAATPAVTTRYTASPILRNCFTNAAADASCASSYGSIVTGATGFVSGVLSSSTATYNEVGVFYLTLLDTSFAAVDAADGTLADCSVSGYYVCSAATPIGRFVPDHFDTAVTQVSNVPMACPAGLTCPNLYNGIVYSGQPFSVKVRAMNGFATSAPTVRYSAASGLSKAVTLAAWDGKGSAISQNPPAVTPGALSGNSVPAASFADGVATTSTPAYTLPNAYPSTTPTAPTDIYVRADESAGGDNVTSLRSTDPTTSSVEGGVKVVNGRVMVPNAYGSELLPLPINNVEVQYYNGNFWINSSTDMTLLAVDNVNISNCLGNLSNFTPPCITAGSATLANGMGMITLIAPGAGNDGSVDVKLNGGGWPDWLPSTTGRATFGIYKGNSKFIYIREVY